MQGIVDRAMLDEMVKAIENNDVEALIRASGFTPATLGPLIDTIESTYQKSAENTVDGWPKTIVTPTGRMTFTFDMRNPKVEENLKNKSSELITRISDEVRGNIRTTLEQGMIKGNNPRTTALDIVGRINPSTKKREGGVIGLTENQTNWVSTAQRNLEQLDKKYFTMELRDKRFDKLVKKAIDSNQPLSSLDVEKLVTAYKTKALKYRGEMIARTEASQAFARAEYDAHIQLIEDGSIPRKYINKWWDDVGDGRTRTSHLLLGQKYNRKNPIPFDEPFITVFGAKMLHPGDKSLGAPPKEIIACRCRIVYDVDWIGIGSDE
jgi:hypothetical protein